MAATETRADRLELLEDECTYTPKGFPHPSSKSTFDMPCLAIDTPDDVLEMEATGVAVLCEATDVDGVTHNANVTITKRDGVAVDDADQVSRSVKGIKNDHTGFILLMLADD